MIDLRSAVERELPGVLDDLARLVSLPSVSADAERRGDVAATAKAIAELLTEAGCPEVRLVDEGGHPAIVAHYPAPDGRPTVCLYAHYDVQPTGDPALWSSDPFTVEQRGDRLFGRGVVDDKAGVAVHLAVLRAFEGNPPVGVTLFIEGEEEVGSHSLPAIMEHHSDLLDCDAFVIMDSANWAVGAPAFTTSLRGVIDLTVTVKTLDHALHSGQYGGVAPDALTAMVRLLSCLHDEAGDVAVPGLERTEVADLVYPPERLAAESGVLPGVAYTGTGSVVERLWGRPAISVVALDATPVDRASNTLTPTCRAKVSMRISAAQDADAALEALKAHLLANAPWGAQVEFSGENAAPGCAIDISGPICTAYSEAIGEAWGVPAVAMGMGGSIPMLSDFQESFPKAELVVVGICDPDSRMHGIDESLHLGDFKAACVAEALWLQKLADA